MENQPVAYKEIQKQLDLTVPDNWQPGIASSIKSLSLLAGTTEDEFLHIGSRLQEFYQRSTEINEMANSLVDSVSGEVVQALIERLKNMMNDMDAYLSSAKQQGRDSCDILERITALLQQVEQPLGGFQKMYKTLRMLGISTKIESSRIGEKGLGFLTLAMDVERLSHLVNDKSASILGHNCILESIITENLALVRMAESKQDQEISRIFKNITSSIEALISVNAACSSFAAMVASVSQEVSANISGVVSSMQAHDITRQQVEHIVEALTRLETDINAQAAGGSVSLELIAEVGDVCELQAAQLRHSISELSSAAAVMVENLRDIASKQSMLTDQTSRVMGSENGSGSSFVEDVSRGMHDVTEILSECAKTDQELSVTMRKVADTIGEISNFVEDIEDIGSEIDLIALNSQIMAAHTGKEGAALGVLAEAIKRLSLEAVVQTEMVSKTLNQVKDVTGHILYETEKEEEEVASRIVVMETDVNETMGNLDNMHSSLLEQLDALNRGVTRLGSDIENATTDISIQDKAGQLSENVFEHLDRIVAESREIAPASSEFKENLRHMEEKYTMQSERNIHEALVMKRSGGTALPTARTAEARADSGSESEFGDNVDLF